jgi:gliding motility-associated-like protein
MLKRIFAAFILLAGINLCAHAQLLEPNQPEQDACNAILLCGTTFHTPYSYVGEGLVADLTFSPCSGGEGNSVWFELNVAADGTIAFSIIPVDTFDDYDFLVVDITDLDCDDFNSSDVVRCNFNNNLSGSNPGGVVGISSVGTLDYVAAGTFGSSFANDIDAVAGERYLIMINNWGYSGGTSSGFTLDFGESTAIFNTEGPPAYDTIATKCDYSTSISVHMTQRLQCSSLSADASDYYLSPSGTIASITGLGCNDDGEGYTEELEFTFFPPLEPGTYTLHPQAGSDGNSVLNLCDEEHPYEDVITFTIPPRPTVISTDFSCRTLTVTTNKPIKCASVAADGSDFIISGPGTATITAAAPIGCSPTGYTNTFSITLAAPMAATGTYTLTAQKGSDGNTLLDSCDFAQLVGDFYTFDVNSLSPQLSLPDTLVTCIGDSILLPLEVLNEYPEVAYSYVWNPAIGLSSTGVKQPHASPMIQQTYDVWVFTSDPATCGVRDTITVRVLQGFDIFTNDTAICAGEMVQVISSGSNEYSYQWTPAEGVTDPTDKNSTIAPIATEIYALTASYPGCSDSTVYLKIEVQPIPTVDLGEYERFQCAGDTTILEALVSPLTSLYDYTYTWSPAGEYGPLGTPNTIYHGDTSIILHLQVSSPAGCKHEDSVHINVYPRLWTDVTVRDTGVCPGGSVQLGVVGGQTYEWMPADGLDNTSIASPTATPGTSTHYTVVVTDEYGCKDTQAVYVQVHSEAVVNMPDSVSIYPGESWQMDPAGNGLYFTWFPPSGLSATNISNPIAQPEVRTRYFVDVATEHGCTTRDSIDVLVVGTTLDMPNAFVPGSGTNSEFKVSKRGIATIKSFKIFDRWGVKVFETTNIDQGWDGTYNGTPQPAGVYVYIIEAFTENSKPFVHQGNVTLIR